MRTYNWFWLLLLSAWLALPPLAGAEPVRLGIMAEDPRLASVADLLTAELSRRHDLALLEREQLRRVLKEQSLSTAHSDLIKVGQTLGADGLLLLDIVDLQLQSRVTARLIAVKPGVVLDFSDHPFPIQGEGEWRKLLTHRLDPLLPKLGVLAKDALPISILNLRSTVKSAAGEQLERRITFLLFSRLMQQKEVFVLERQKLQTLAEEKFRKGVEDSRFWSSGYLLEGTIDKTGYKPNLVTLSVRLTPPAAAAPIDFETTGPRAELPVVVEKLASKILTALKGNSPTAEWNTKDEANRFFEEAKWALQWEMLPEAVVALNSAWALGKSDSNCAFLRVESCAKLAVPCEPNYRQNQMFDLQRRVWVPLIPDPKTLGFAVQSLAAYLEFSDTLPAGFPERGSRWYLLGIETLERASKVLQLFHFFPDSQVGLTDRLADLRELARAVAGWIASSHSVRNYYWQSTRATDNTEVSLVAAMPNILKCELDYGCFWQDRPEDAIALYRDLLNSPYFYFIHSKFCIRAPQSPRLAAWNPADRGRAPSVWDSFLKELVGSTNLHMRIEGQFLQLADETSESRRTTIFNNLFTNLFHTAASALSNSVPLRNMQWGAEDAIAVSWDSIPHTQESWVARPWAERVRELQAADNKASFEEQKNYLRNNTPFDMSSFQKTFRFLYYSKEQASELLPLIDSYKSKLAASDQRQQALQSLISVEQYAWHSLAPFGRTASTQPANQASVVQPETPPPPLRVAQQQPASVSRQITNNPAPQRRPSPASTNFALIPGTAFHLVPKPLLEKAGVAQPIVNAHRFSEKKLWLELRYGTRNEWRSAIASWDPAADTWDIIPCPDKQSDTRMLGQPSFLGGEAESGLYFQPFGGALYLSQWNNPLRKMDLEARHWETLPLPVVKPTQLFAINGHLYGANDELIFEILDAGQSTRLLAACRRRPAASRLDSLGNFGDATLLPGPANTLRVSIAGRVFSWDERDWNEMFTLREAKPSTFIDGTLFRGSNPNRLWLLPNGRTNAELCCEDPSALDNTRAPRKASANLRAPLAESLSPTWKAPGPLLRPSTAAGTRNSNLYFASAHNYGSNWVAELACLARGVPSPLTMRVGLGSVAGSLYTEETRPFQLTTYAHLRPWLEFASDALILGHGRWTGVWTIPLPALDTTFKEEKE